jgi:hypothetical protein
MQVPKTCVLPLDDTPTRGLKILSTVFKRMNLNRVIEDRLLTSVDLSLILLKDLCFNHMPGLIIEQSGLRVTGLPSLQVLDTRSVYPFSG